MVKTPMSNRGLEQHTMQIPGVLRFTKRWSKSIGLRIKDSPDSVCWAGSIYRVSVSASGPVLRAAICQ